MPAFKTLLLLAALTASSLSMAARAEDPPVGLILNFGPSLYAADGGICTQPEGLAIDPDGNLYADSSAQIGGIAHICVLSPEGKIIDVIEVQPGPTGIVGLVGEYWRDGFLYVLDQADNVPPHGRVLKINPRTHAYTTFATGFNFPNCIVSDRDGNFFVTDSFLGEIFRIDAETLAVTVWNASPVLTSTNPNQPVGANDLAFDRDEKYLYVSNAGNRTVHRIAVNPDESSGAVELFADGPTVDQQMALPSPTALFYADGIQFDVKGNLYVMSNITNEVEVYAPGGRLIHRYAGTGANTMDFNASPVFKGRTLYVSDFSNNDNGVGSKISVMTAPHRGLPLPR